MPLQISITKNEAIKDVVKRGVHFEGSLLIGLRGRALKIFHNEGYPAINVNICGKHFKIRVHRIKAYILYGEKVFEEGIEVRHRNSDKEDFSDKNIILGNRSDNIQDIPREYRIAYATNAASHLRKLNAEEIKHIRDRYNSGGITLLKLSKMYNVTKSTIHYIIKNVTYRNV